MNCRKASELLSAAHERQLSRSERWGLRVHLFLCGACRRFRDSLLFLQQALRAAHPKRSPRCSLPAVDSQSNAVPRSKPSCAKPHADDFFREKIFIQFVTTAEVCD